MGKLFWVSLIFLCLLFVNCCGVCFCVVLLEELVVMMWLGCLCVYVDDGVFDSVM